MESKRCRILSISDTPTGSSGTDSISDTATSSVSNAISYTITGSGTVADTTRGSKMCQQEHHD